MRWAGGTGDCPRREFSPRPAQFRESVGSYCLSRSKSNVDPRGKRGLERLPDGENDFWHPCCFTEQRNLRTLTSQPRSQPRSEGHEPPSLVTEGTASAHPSYRQRASGTPRTTPPARPLLHRDGLPRWVEARFRLAGQLASFRSTMGEVVDRKRGYLAGFFFSSRPVFPGFRVLPVYPARQVCLESAETTRIPQKSALNGCFGPILGTSRCDISTELRRAFSRFSCFGRDRGTDRVHSGGVRPNGAEPTRSRGHPEVIGSLKVLRLAVDLPDLAVVERQPPDRTP